MTWDTRVSHLRSKPMAVLVTAAALFAAVALVGSVILIGNILG